MFFSRTHRAAFSIIELLLVIAIIIFLVKVLIPRYSQYYAKARQAEVALNLSAAYTAQQTYQLEHGHYAPTLQALGWTPRGYTDNPAKTHNSYTYGIGPGSEGVTVFTGSSKTSGTLLEGGFLDSNRFVLKAAMQTGDTQDLWKIDETGELQHE